MKRNRNFLKEVVFLLKLTTFMIIAICQLTFLSEVQASGKIVIRKTPGLDVKVQPQKPLGFDSQWAFPNAQQQTFPMRFSVAPIRPNASKETPENPVEIEDDKNPSKSGGVDISRFHYAGLVRLSEDAILINVKKGRDNRYRVMLPKPGPFTENPYPQEVFTNGQARRIVVWNGKDDETGEQMIICNDELRSATGQIEAVLSIMPLPGEPLQIKRAADSFDVLQAELIKKLDFKNKIVNHKHVPWNGRITPYCSQSFEIHNLDEFVAIANAMIFNLYGDSAQLQIRPKQLGAVKNLLDKGYTWFAFDVSMLRDWGTITEPIAYRTKSRNVCIPLLDGKIGGASNHTVMRAIIITPSETTLSLVKNEGLADDAVEFLGKKSVEFTVQELEKLSPEVAEFCKKHKINKALVRQVSIENNVDGYPCDFKMITYPDVPAKESKDDLVQDKPDPDPNAAANPTEQPTAETPDVKGNNGAAEKKDGVNMNNPSKNNQDNKNAPSNSQNPGKKW